MDLDAPAGCRARRTGANARQKDWRSPPRCRSCAHTNAFWRALCIEAMGTCEARRGVGGSAQADYGQQRATVRVLRDGRVAGLAARGFANFFLHWHAAFKAAFDSDLRYAIDPQQIGYVNDRKGMCHKHDCTAYVDIRSLGLLDPACDIVVGNRTLRTSPSAVRHLPQVLKKSHSWPAVISSTLRANPQLTQLTFTCDSCEDGDFSTTAAELRRRLLGLPPSPPPGAKGRQQQRSRLVRIAVHLRRGDLLFANRAERLLPDAWYVRHINTLLELCELWWLHCTVDLYTQGIESSEEPVSLRDVKNPSLRYKDAQGVQVDERGRPTDWAPLLHRCDGCLTVHLNGKLEPLLRVLASADVLLGSCSALSHVAAALSHGIALLPISLYTVKGYAGVLSLKGMRNRSLLLSTSADSASVAKDLAKDGSTSLADAKSSSLSHIRGSLAQLLVLQQLGAHIERLVGGYKPFTVVTMSRTPIPSGIGVTTRALLETYVREHGYSLVVAHSLPSAWYKIPLIASVVPEGEWALWMDDDIAIASWHNLSLWTAAAEARGASLVVQHGGPRVNNGAFLIRMDEAGRKFLRAWHRQWPSSPYASDNGAFNIALAGNSKLTPECQQLVHKPRRHTPLSTFDHCLNKAMSGSAEMCNVGDARMHVASGSRALVLCPRGPLPNLQSESRQLVKQRGHSAMMQFAQEDFSLHTKNAADLVMVRRRSPLLT